MKRDCDLRIRERKFKVKSLFTGAGMLGKRFNQFGWVPPGGGGAEVKSESVYVVKSRREL